MKDQIVMSKTNGACCVAVPLYRRHQEDSLDPRYKISLVSYSDKPIAYAIDYGEGIQLMSAEFVEKNLEFLGDL